MTAVNIILPHQLFENTTGFSKTVPVFLIEESLFFNQYNFHKQKIAFHRASMKFYESYLIEKGYNVTYIEANNKLADIRQLISKLIIDGCKKITMINPTDNWIEKRVNSFSTNTKINWLKNPSFLNAKEELIQFFNPAKKKYFQTTFYKEQRLKRNILIENGKPVGGKWTFDAENRKKYPKSKTPPILNFPKNNSFFEEALQYTKQYYDKNIGHLNKNTIYPTTFQEAKTWLQNFFTSRFSEFGDYEDAIVEEKHFLNHSLLSPLMNSGLLTPHFVISETISYAKKNNIPMNSLEGFIRQIIGWREFIRGVYEVKGGKERTTNFWKHTNKIPQSFYTGTTGIEPVDETIKKVLKTGYAHHIERLMILGNFMLLCEISPDEIYKWFMELFIDSYDWVMVPNVYGMGSFADGGIFSTKPYISSSNYIKKMSNYKNGDWQKTWDGLFWLFMDKHRVFFKKNPRLSMLISNFDKMDASKRTLHFSNAEHFLKKLYDK